MISRRSLLAFLALASLGAAPPIAPSAPPTPAPVVQASGKAPAPPAGVMAPDDLKVAPEAPLRDRPTEWVATVGADDSAQLYADLNALAGGAVHIIFRSGASVRVHLEGCATTGVVIRQASGARVIYDYGLIEWVRASP